MRKLLISSALAVTALAAPAYAQSPAVLFTNGIYTVPVGYTAPIFQNFNSGSGTGTAYAPAANETVFGTSLSESGTVPGTSVDPDTTPGNKYLSIVGGTYSVSLASPVQFFSFILGSLDTYNSVTLFFNNSTSKTYTGSDIINQAVTFNSTGNSGVSGRVSYDAGGQAGIIGATFQSNGASFEIDDLASAVPEPAAWGMMILGFGLVGSQLRTRRRTQAKLAIA